ncbi:MAG: GAF domain-containing protein [Rhodospirillales bacterium]|nr:GAF domain-containing protein [Rhodospirillales bacterium]
MRPGAEGAIFLLPKTDGGGEGAEAGRTTGDDRAAEAVAAVAAAVAAIVVQDEPAALSRTVAREAARLLDAERATLFFLDDAGSTLTAIPEGNGGEASMLRLPRGRGLPWAALAAGRVVNTPQACAHRHLEGGGDEHVGGLFRSALAAPIVSGAGPLGVLEVADKAHGSFGRTDQHRLAALCAAIAAAVENAKLLAHLTAEKCVNAMMSRYMDPRLATLLLEGDGDALCGRPVRATMLFCDLRNSTALAEDLGPEGMVSLLNEFFTRVASCLRSEGGMLDKFIGDAVLGAFGVPFSGEDDEDRAVRAALALTAALRQWNETRRAKDLAALRIGVGINTDIVVAGNVGSPERMDYTVTGAGVNLAARLEKACKRYGAEILVSGHTVRRLRGRYAIRPVDDICIPGKVDPVRIYEVVSDHAAQAGANLHDALSAFSRGVALRRQGRHGAAEACFRTCLSLDPGDRGAAIQLQACRRSLGAAGS